MRIKAVIVTFCLVLFLIAAVFVYIFISDNAGSDEDEKNTDVVEARNDSAGEKPVGSIYSEFEGDISQAPAIFTNNLGRNEFAIDESRSVSIEFIPNGEDTKLELDDQNGYTWELMIPGNALLEKRIITMTVLSDIQNDVLGSMAGGIMLEPDGLRFLEPAVLKITGPDISKASFLLSSKNDGSDTGLAFHKSRDERLTGTIHHFSGYFIYHFRDYPKLDAEAKDLLLCLYEAEVQTRNLLNNPIDLPSPPPVPLKCTPIENSQVSEGIVDMFLLEFMSPESDYLERFIDFETRYKDITGEYYDKKLTYVSLLANRLIEKVDKLIEAYKPDPDKFIPIYAAYKIVDEYMRNIPDVDFESREDVFSDWAKSIFDHYIDEAREKHDYSAISGAFRAMDIISLLEGEAETDIEGYYKRITDAMSFKLNIETLLDVPGYIITVKGEGTLKARIEGLHDLAFQGEVILGYQYNGEDDGLTIVPEEFSVNVAVRNWEPCKSEKIDIFVESLGSDAEEHIYEFTSGEHSFFNPIVNDFAEGFFEKEITRVPFDCTDGSSENLEMIDFNVDLRNGQSAAVEETIERERSATYSKIKVLLSLKHSPD